MKVKKVGICSLVFVLVLAVAACNSVNSDQGKQLESTKENGKVVVDLWHSMGTKVGKPLEKLVNDFNGSQDKYEVRLEYQGSYEESFNKLSTVFGTGEEPAIIQLQETAMQPMINSGFVTPVQQFIDAENFDISFLEENILGYYTIDNTLYSMPFNTSNAVMFYNKDAFKEVGLDPENPPHTFSEIAEAAKKLTKINGTNVDRYGFSMLIYSWFFEQLMANQGGLIINNDNGRSGLATEAVFNSEEGVRIFDWLKKMNEDGTLGNFGRKYDDIRAAFKSEKVAMYLDSTAETAPNIEDCTFEVGTAPIPIPDGMEPQGFVMGGGSLWMIDSHAEETKQGAWEFMKFMTNLDNQAYWAVNTGYFPVNKQAYDEDIMKENLETYPQFHTAIEQLQTTKLGGMVTGVPQEIRATIDEQIERLYQGDVNSQEALDAAVKKSNKALDMYLKTQKK